MNRLAFFPGKTIGVKSKQFYILLMRGAQNGMVAGVARPLRIER